MDFEGAKIQALAAILEGDDLYIQRKICRDYSKAFFTPLHEVYKLPFSFIVQNWLEDKLEGLKHSDLVHTAQNAIGIDEDEEALIQEQIKQFEEEYNRSLKPQDDQEMSLDFSGLDDSDEEE